MKLYLAGPMRGYPEFNFPAFRTYATLLRQKGHEVFSPAEADERRHGKNIAAGNMTGSEEQAIKDHGFDLRVALGEDLAWICAEADGIAMIPGWQESKGATAEHATAVALGLKIIYLEEGV